MTPTSARLFLSGPVHKVLIDMVCWLIAGGTAVRLLLEAAQHDYPTGLIHPKGFQPDRPGTES